MGKLYPLNTSDSANFAIGQKMRMLVNLSTEYSKSSKYESVGIIRNESELSFTKENIDYKDGENDWLSMPKSETVEFSCASMQPGQRRIVAYLMGLDDVSTTSTAYDEIKSDGVLVTARKVPVKLFTTQSDGKDVCFEMVAGQIVGDSAALNFGGSEPTSFPFKIRATVKSTSTLGYKKYRWQFEK